MFKKFKLTFFVAYFNLGELRNFFPNFLILKNYLGEVKFFTSVMWLNFCIE